MILHAKTYLTATCISVTMFASDMACAETTPPLDIAQVKVVFAEAKDISDREGGRLWGMKLYGGMFFVDTETRYVVANEPDPQGVLHAEDGVYVGTLPKDVIISNAPTVWEGKCWTQLMWPMYGDALTQHIALAHEPFHCIQPALHLDAPDSLNLHLDTPEGRLWLQLEWRALAAALIETGPSQTQAIDDALAFRDYRHQLFPGSAKTEASLEIAEGVPEYTGVVAGAPDRYSGLWRATSKLSYPEQSGTFVRSFAYTSGPAYGLLLDERLPGWRTKLNMQSDLGALIASTLHGKTQTSAEKRAPYYGEAALRMTEAERAAKAAAEKTHYRALLVDGPTLTLQATGKFAFSFNPSTLVGLGDVGAVYPTFHATDVWGALDVKEGVLVPTDFSRAIVAAPQNPTGLHIDGPGWTLDITPGWKLAPGAKPGSYTMQKD
ncbi:MAG: hypothetical protein PHP45_01775 [Elusimicrobiales bacterium]|nr:hypothetical protein [Elusimicrobiales bacterium]